MPQDTNTSHQGSRDTDPALDQQPSVGVALIQSWSRVRRGLIVLTVCALLLPITLWAVPPGKITIDTPVFQAEWDPHSPAPDVPDAQRRLATTYDAFHEGQIAVLKEMATALREHA